MFNLDLDVNTALLVKFLELHLGYLILNLDIEIASNIWIVSDIEMIFDIELIARH